MGLLTKLKTVEIENKVNKHQMQRLKKNEETAHNAGDDNRNRIREEIKIAQLLDFQKYFYYSFLGYISIIVGKLWENTISIKNINLENYQIEMCIFSSESNLI